MLKVLIKYLKKFIVIILRGVATEENIKNKIQHSQITMHKSYLKYNKGR